MIIYNSFDEVPSINIDKHTVTSKESYHCQLSEYFKFKSKFSSNALSVIFALKNGKPWLLKVTVCIRTSRIRVKNCWTKTAGVSGKHDNHIQCISGFNLLPPKNMSYCCANLSAKFKLLWIKSETKSFTSKADYFQNKTHIYS